MSTTTDLNPNHDDNGFAWGSPAALAAFREKYKPRTFRIIRTYQGDTPNRVVKHRLTLAEAQAHCSDPETCSNTATSAQARRRTNTHGPWFDGYEEENR